MQRYGEFEDMNWSTFLYDIAKKSLQHELDPTREDRRFHLSDVSLLTRPYRRGPHHPHLFKAPTDDMLARSRTWTFSEIYGLLHGYSVILAKTDAVSGLTRRVYIQFFIASTSEFGRRLYYQAISLDSDDSERVAYHLEFKIDNDSFDCILPETCSMHTLNLL